ncbi:MAG: leucyl aminopeptidase, partial [Nanoarchaeota archaeon]
MPPKIEVISDKLEEIKGQCLVIAFFEGKLGLSNEISKFDGTINSLISASIKNKDFKAEEGEIKLIYVNANMKYLALLGLGKEEKFNLNKLTDNIAAVSRRIRNAGIKSFAIHLSSLKNKAYEQKEYLEKITQSIILSLYQFLKFKTKDLDKIKNLEKASIIVDKNILEEANKIAMEAAIYAEAVNKTRDLVNTPPNIANPVYVAEYAKEVAKKNNLTCTIFDEKQIEKMGMECFMAVARGSANKPRLVILRYKGSGNEKPIVLVGKGITFDTGGINVKPAAYLNTMKDDKASACGVIHVMEVCAKLKLKLNVIGVLALAENMISGKSYRPDDVLKSYSGITVEVTNTDAEGRLILADALSYSLKYKPKAIIDIATLTGASIIALGYFASPVLGNSQQLIDKIKAASE